MPHRFYLPSLPESGTAVLEDLEAHHLIHVLRGRPSDIVELFDGAGRAARAQVVSVSRKSVDLQILESFRIDPAARHVVLGVAVPKGDRFDWLIEKATELGVTRLVPLLTARSVVDPRAGKLDKLRHTVIAACKQSGRNDLLQLSSVTPWRDFVTSHLTGRASFLAHPHPTAIAMNSTLLSNASAVTFAVGPEGGFTDEEVAMAIEYGAQAVSLGPNILRIETAALALAAYCL